MSASPQHNPSGGPLRPWQQKLHTIIFEADTPGGKFFDVALLWAILLSLAVVMMESVKEIDRDYGQLLNVFEWVFTGLFTLEYFLRIISVKRPLSYIFSFWGIIDLFSILPTYFGIFFSGYHTLVVIRSVRLLRVFRIFKLHQFTGEGSKLMDALIASRIKIMVFLIAVMTLVTILGTLMYAIEGQQEGTGFTSIPRSIYWAIVTLTTVGYGDISPTTAVGQAIASVIMILGYAIIAVPTGIVTAEAVSQNSEKVTGQACPNCSREGHSSDADFCKHCGHDLHPERRKP